MKILIVDDEPIILHSIKDMVLHMNIPEVCVFTADNAADAFFLLKKEKPEITLSDIQMPCKNGIDLLKRINDDKIETLVIFITGYPDFSYAQAALRYHAFDYLLKPISLESLSACLKKAMDTLQANLRTKKLADTMSKFYKENLTLLKKQFLENLLINPFASFSADIYQQFISLNLKLNRFCMIGLRCDMNNTNSLQNQEYYIAYSLSKMINQDYARLTSCYIGNIVYIIYPLENSSEDMDKILSFTSSLKIYAKEKLFSTINISVSTAADTIQQIPKLNKQILHCFSFDKTYFSSDSDNMIFFDDIDNYNTSLLEINECITFLVNAIQAKNKEAAEQITEKFFSFIKKEDISVQQDSIQLVELNLHCQLRNTLTSSVDISYLTHPITRYCMAEPQSEHSKTVFKNCVNNIIQELSAISSKHSNQLINSIIDYINKNYSLQIGLSDVSEYTGRNASYISRLLNKELHMGFAQLLTERRLAAAKDLLANTSYKISDISEKVGYTTPKYFHQVFVSNLEMTPSDYRTIMKQF